jgi:hypothetical protein
MFDAFVFMLLYYKDPAGTCLLCVQTTIRSFKLVVNRRDLILPEILAAGPGSGTATGSRRRRNVNVAATRGAAGG